MLIVYLCMAIPLLALIWHASLQYGKFGRTINRIPGLKPVPIFGNLLSIIISKNDMWSTVHCLFQKYYPIFRAWGFWNCAVFMCHPDDLKILLSCKKNISKCHVVYGNLKYADIDGIIASSGQRWQHRRKLLNPAFSLNHLEIYSEKINKRANKFVADLTSRGDVFVQNIASILLKFALGAVCDAVMDFDTNSMPDDKEKEFRDAVNEFFEITLLRTQRPYIYDFMMPFLPIGWRLARVCKILNNFRNKIIKERRKYYDRGECIFNDNCEAKTEDATINTSIKGLNKNFAVIDLLLLAEKKGLVDEHGIAEEVLTIVAAGYETTGMAMAFLLTLLAEHKEQQNLARTEIIEILGDDDCITISHVKKMVYLERCVKETLRLFPTAPHVGRIITDELTLSKHTLPPGLLTVMSFYDLHRDCHFWPDPDKFDPDRFLPDNVKQRHPFAYLPFSAGPRNCIGETASNNRHLAKRQIMSIREIFVASRVPIYHVPYPTYARREYVPAIPATSDVDAYRVQTPKPASLPKESHSEVGFEMSYEEMIELFDELYERMPRGTKTREELQKEFLPWLEECCKNIELCRIKKDCPYI